MNTESKNAQTLSAAETQTFEARLSLLDVEMLYRSMLIRFIKRYSPEEMSFLIGEHPLFISKMEELQRLQYCMGILWEKHWLVSEFGSSFLMPTYPVAEEMGNYQLVKTIYSDRTTYQMNKIHHDGDNEIIFVLKEDNHVVEEFPRSTKQEENALHIAIKALIDLNYFEKERSAHQLLKHCQSLIYDHIEPKNLSKVLTSFTHQKHFPKLKRVKTKHWGYEYVMVEQPNK